MKVVGERRGKFRSLVLPRSKRYERKLRQDICLMYLSGVSTRTLSLISGKLLGRKVSAGEVSRVIKELVKAVESRKKPERTLRQLILPKIVDTTLKICFLRASNDRKDN